MKSDSRTVLQWNVFISCFLNFTVLYFISTYNYLLFHSIAEIYSIIIAFSIFIIARNTKEYIEKNYLLIIGIAYLFIGNLDMLHALSYKNMGIFQKHDSNLSAQLWIAARYMEGFTLLFAPLLNGKMLRTGVVFYCYLFLTTILLLSIFYWNIFPDCFVDGAGLTTFKKTSEYIISGILLAALYLLYQIRHDFDPHIFRFLSISILLTIASELAFTFYINVYGFSNLVGHIFKVASFYMIYKSFLYTGLKKPNALMFKEISEKKRRYKQMFETNQAIKLIINPADGSIVEANTAACSFYGYSKDEITSLKITDINTLPPDRVFKEMKKAKSEKKLSHEFSHKLSSGEIRDVEVYSSPIEHKQHTFLYSIIHDITERKKTDKKLNEVSHHLNERVKELNCLYDISNLMDFDMSTKEFLQKVVERIPESWQYSEITCARIKFENQTFITQNFQESTWNQTQAIKIDGDSVGVLEVFYLEEKPELDEGPFLKEERALLNALAEKLGRTIKQKQTEENLKNSEARFKKLITKSPLPMVITDDNQDISFYNEKFTESFGYTLEDVSTAEKWWETAYPDEGYREKVQQSWESAIEKAGADNTDIEMQQWDLTVKDRTKRTCEFYMVPIPECSLIIIIDITDRKSTEKELDKYRKNLEVLVKERTIDLEISKDRFKNIFNNMITGGAIYEVIEDGKDFRIIEFNPAGENIDQINAKDIIGKSLTHVFPGVEEFGLLDVLRRVWQSGKPEHHPAGIYHDNRIEGWRDNYIFKLPSGEIVVLYNDITEQKQAEKEKKKLETQLRQSQKMESIGTLAGGIAHDFNNILAAIMGYTELAISDLPDNSAKREELNYVLKAGNRATELVQQILTFSRKTSKELKPLQIQIIVREAIKLLRASIPATIEIWKNIDPDCGTVLADPTHIHQMVMNLFTNAYQAMKKKGGILGISLQQMELVHEDLRNKIHLKPGTYLKLEISDTGTGISKDVLDKIFEPYFTTKKKEEGTGLGLAVVHGIIADLKGEITVYSEPGKGAVFCVYLPVRKTVKETTQRTASLPFPMGKERILLVDDDPDLVQMHKKIIETLGYQVTALTSSIDTLDMFQKAPDSFDLVITDMTMPNITGSELARQILDIRKDMPIILCSGYSELINSDQAKTMGIYGYVSKPILKRPFAETIRDVLDKKIMNKGHGII